MDIKGRINSLLGLCRDIGKSLSYSKRGGYNDKDRADSIVSQIGEAKGMVRDTRERYFNARSKAIRCIIK